MIEDFKPMIADKVKDIDIVMLLLTQDTHRSCHCNDLKDERLETGLSKCLATNLHRTLK